MWNAKSMTCVRSLACGYGTCCAFGPGNRHAIVGTKTGALQVFDVSTGDMIEEIAEAHEVRRHESLLRCAFMCCVCRRECL